MNVESLSYLTASVFSVKAEVKLVARSWWVQKCNYGIA